MAAYKFGAVGMAGGIIALAAVAAWLGWLTPATRKAERRSSRDRW